VLRWEVVVASATAVAAAELGDKTQLAAIALSARGRPLAAFAASTLGFVAANIAAAALGCALRVALPLELVGAAAGAAFIAAGLASLLRRGDRLERECSFWRGFCLVFLAELGDKTNLATLALAASTGAFAEVVVGVSAAAAALMGLAAVLGAALSRALPEKALRSASSLAFIAIGAALLAQALLA
jgi:putative Ca2+/H+ antiporter (TMEM165/GDT1 family)